MSGDMQPRRFIRLAGLVLLVATGLGGAAHAAEEKWLLEGMIDPTLWKTSDGSQLLARNEGDAAADATLRLFLAAELVPRFDLVVVGTAYGATDDNGSDTDFEQAFVRYSIRKAQPLYLEAGKIVTPLGNFSARYLPTVNPLIGKPTSYGVSYPLGVQLAGSLARFDFRVAMVDLPLTNQSYLPEAGSHPRPAVAFGFTPLTGARIGVYYTAGPYLSDEIDPYLPPGAAWEDYGQQVAGVDLQWSRGHVELNADYAENSYDVPTYAEEYRGRAWYGEAKYTFAPRWFAAARYEENLYLYSQPLPNGYWIAALPTVRAIEGGAGYRFDRLTEIKASARVDRWSVEPGEEAMLPDGWAAAVQLVHRFDVRSWFENPAAR